MREKTVLFCRLLLHVAGQAVKCGWTGGKVGAVDVYESKGLMGKAFA